MDSLERRLGVWTELSAHSRDWPQEQREDVAGAPLHGGHQPYWQQSGLSSQYIRLLRAGLPSLLPHFSGIVTKSILFYHFIVIQFVQLYFDKKNFNLLLLLKIVKSSIRIKLNLHCIKASTSSVSLHVQVTVYSYYGFHSSLARKLDPLSQNGEL